MEKIFNRVKSYDHLIAALKRAGYTFIETFISFLAVGMTVSEAPWKVALSTSLVASIISFGKSILVGMPEVTDGEKEVH